MSQLRNSKVIAVSRFRSSGKGSAYLMALSFSYDFESFSPAYFNPVPSSSRLANSRVLGLQLHFTESGAATGRNLVEAFLILSRLSRISGLMIGFRDEHLRSLVSNRSRIYVNCGEAPSGIQPDFRIYFSFLPVPCFPSS